jgi:hypothetical protein
LTPRIVVAAKAEARACCSIPESDTSPPISALTAASAAHPSSAARRQTRGYLVGAILGTRRITWRLDTLRAAATHAAKIEAEGHAATIAAIPLPPGWLRVRPGRAPAMMRTILLVLVGFLAGLITGAALARWAAGAMIYRGGNPNRAPDDPGEATIVGVDEAEAFAQPAGEGAGEGHRAER